MGNSWDSPSRFFPPSAHCVVASKEAAAPPNAATLDPTVSLEIWRLLGALELLPINLKIELGDDIVELLPKRKLEKGSGHDALDLGTIGTAGPASWTAQHGGSGAARSAWLEAILNHPDDEPDVLRGGHADVPSHR